MDQRTAGFAPRRLMREFDFAHAVDDRPPEIPEHGERFRLNHRFIDHFPDNGEFYESPRATFARDETVGESNQFEQAFLPGVHAHFDVDPFIRFGGGKKIRGDSERLGAAFFCAARYRGHDAAVTTAANGEAGIGQCATERACVFVVGFAFAWT